ncbi:MAG: prepilin-type N-terminal cleavage/methylation domain-containing protein [Nitrospirota bacterium]
MLRKPASFALASFSPSTYPSGCASGLDSQWPCLEEGASLCEEAVLANAGRVRSLAFVSLLRDSPLSSTEADRFHRSRLSRLSRASRLLPQALRASRGFTILEILIVLFLLAGLLGIVLPRISLEENLGSVGRRMVGTVRSLQSLAMETQQTLRLYIDIDRGVYWLMILDGNQEKVPIENPIWATPLHLPDAIRFSDIVIARIIKSAGRVDLSFYPTGRIDPATMHLVDDHNNLLAIAIEPVTGAIRMSDERIEPPLPIPLIILDRVKPLLKMTEPVKESPQP